MLRMPERFGRVDVAESGDHALIEQHRLDRTALLRERAVQRTSAVSVASRGSGPRPRSGSRVRRMQIERAQRTRIVEHDARVVGRT